MTDKPLLDVPAYFELQRAEPGTIVQLDKPSIVDEYYRLKDREADMVYVLENLLMWWPEIQYKLSDAEVAIFKPVIERSQHLLITR